jgi:uncharacterized Ntn-hydrolase superfamily protein
MTYTILGYCSRSGALGLGIATYSLAAGGLCPAIRSNTGVITSQAFVNPELRGLGATLLVNGFPAGQVLEQLKAADPNIDYRQVGVLDRLGRGAAFTGTKTRPWTGHRIGDDHIVLGNVLAGEEVIRAMAGAFEGRKDAPLAERLLLGLEAGRDAGGQVGGSGHLPERSAALIVHGRGDAPEIDLRVDLHEEAVDQLRRLYHEYVPYVAFHRLRWLDPASAPPQEQFATQLNATQASR